MAANDSGVETSNDSNDGVSSVAVNIGVGLSMGIGTGISKIIDITPPPAIMPPTPTSSPNTHEWPNFSPNAFQLNRGEHFAYHICHHCRSIPIIYFIRATCHQEVIITI
ncbi:unnamed protein product [Ceratitis capitata]|uniref:(Mediterranean fruit fly) hypothetical protein n=1 Tax=Ceratitis capitata TaxID=7213 RepID=A0A811UYQ8_CERCA|nr:unnamed protein product [Ceratitis capitata]